MASTEEGGNNSTHDTDPSSSTHLLTQLQTHSKPKDRSATTHDTSHARTLAQNQPITCLLLGDSMFERFKTTGATTAFGPSRAPYPEVFNAGVGGDRISNVIYRLTEKGLLAALRSAGVEYALLEMGTNDLVGDKKALQGLHVEQYGMVVRALQWACPGVRVLVCGLNPKRRVAREGIVEESNAMLEGMVRELVLADPDAIVEYMPSDPRIIDYLEEDGVHLNKEGYDLFAEALWTYYQRLRSPDKKLK